MSSKNKIYQQRASFIYEAGKSPLLQFYLRGRGGKAGCISFNANNTALQSNSCFTLQYIGHHKRVSSVIIFSYKTSF